MVVGGPDLPSASVPPARRTEARRKEVCDLVAPADPADAMAAYYALDYELQ